LAAACREAWEETGLSLEPVSDAIFDLDVHQIPDYRGERAHYHYDVRFILKNVGAAQVVVSTESTAAAWVPLEGVAQYTSEVSLIRMVSKQKQLFVCR
jgi:8-oxo-dGTP pyrophosphatase MutT (NUDIX family)